MTTWIKNAEIGKNKEIKNGRLGRSCGNVHRPHPH